MELNDELKMIPGQTSPLCRHIDAVDLSFLQASSSSIMLLFSMLLVTWRLLSLPEYNIQNPQFLVQVRSCQRGKGKGEVVRVLIQTKVSLWTLQLSPL